MYELRTTPEKKPIVIDSLEEALALFDICDLHFNVKLHVTPELPKIEYDKELYVTFQNKHRIGKALPDGFKIQFSVDTLILGKGLANSEMSDYGQILTPFIKEHQSLVLQYKEGNERALNALMGIFLKSNKGHDAKIVKSELIKIINELWKI